MPRCIWIFFIALSVILSALTLLIGWVGAFLDSSAFWFLWGFFSAYPISQPIGLKIVFSIIDRLD